MKKRGILYNTVFTSTGLWLFIALVCLWIPWLGDAPFRSDAEAAEAVLARSILPGGDWILPGGSAGITCRSPFAAWIIAVFAWVFNGGEVNEYISRLPSALAAIALIMMGYVWARKAQGERFALIMALVTATSSGLFRAAMNSGTDMLLTAAIVGSVYVIHEIRQRPGRDNVCWYAAAAGLLTVATLTGGPLAPVLACVAGAIYLLMRGDNFFKVVFRMLLLCVVSYMLPALWYYAACKRAGDAFPGFSISDIACALYGGSGDATSRYNFVWLLLGMLPWTLLALLSLFRAGTYRHWPFKPAGMLAMVTACTVILFCCLMPCASSDCLLPAYPFMAYGVTVIIESLRGTSVIRFFGRTMAFFGIAIPVCLLVLAFFQNPFVEHFELRHWWQWIFVIIPVPVSIWWYMGRSRSPVAMPTIFTLFLCLSAALF